MWVTDVSHETKPEQIGIYSYGSRNKKRLLPTEVLRLLRITKPEQIWNRNMILGFHERERLENQLREEALLEKLILFNQGKRFGQVVFMAGGAGSGKGFAISNFLEGEKFKVRDVDEYKKAFLKLAKTKDQYSELRNLDLRKGKDVFTLHKFVEDLGVVDKTLNNLLKDVRGDHLPNVLFDITAKNTSKVTDITDRMIAVGYKPENIHMVWVLTNYSVAVMNNANRERVVPDDILLQTHEGAARTMWSFVKSGLHKGVNGAFHIILNNRENTILHVNSKGEKLDGKKDKNGKLIRPLVVKDFSSIWLKREGKKMGTKRELNMKLHDWVSKNVPKTALTTLQMDI